MEITSRLGVEWLFDFQRYQSLHPATIAPCEVLLMAVFWTIQARRHLRQALAEALCRENETQAERKRESEHEQERQAGEAQARSRDESRPCLGVLELTMDRLNDMLAGLFDGASVVVKDQVLGYRRRKDQFILMVEAFGKDNEGSGPFVVKIGPESKLKEEIRGWERCRPPGLKHDLVLLDLREGKILHLDGENWLSLIYGDAQQFLGVSATATFEDAALDCIRSGFPRTLSIEFVIVALFERLGHLLYSQAFVDDPARTDFVLDIPRLDASLARWEDDPACQAARREVNNPTDNGVERFLDPVDYLRYVQHYVPWKVAGPDGTVAIRPASADPNAPELPGLPGPLPLSVIPRMLRGCAHGDLHGRNILVGIVRDQAMWPTVFDYEDMGSGNLVGWDFVKLETELKIRAYLHEFGGGKSADFVRKVKEFEFALNIRTEECHLDRSWPEAGNPATPEERLGTILLAIRRMAAQQLGASHGRPNDWPEEYDFLLACYGTSTARFENLQHRERIGALISAGVAASRLSWPRNLASPDVGSGFMRCSTDDFTCDSDLAAEEEKTVMSQPTFSVEQVLKTPFPSYHKPLELARALNRSGEDAKRNMALTLLEGLRKRYPHVLAVGQEFILSLIEGGEHDQAELALKALENTFANLDEESLCRWGRLFKDRADDYIDLPGARSNWFAPNRDQAEEFYRKSLDKYDQAYRIRSGHYPGVNKATLLLIVGSLKAQRAGKESNSSPSKELLESSELAAVLLDNRGRWSRDQPDDENIWHLATAAEAHLLRQEWAHAAALYREALDGKDITHHARESIRRQLERILLAFRNVEIAIPPPFDDTVAFFAPSPPNGKKTDFG